MRKYNRYKLLLLIPTLMTACTVGPDYVKPTPPPDNEYVREKDLSQFGSQKIDKEKKLSKTWWKEFSSPELNSIIRYAVKNNNTLISMRESLKQAEELENASEGQWFPQIGFNAAGGRVQYGAAFLGPIDNIIPPFTYYEIGPNISYLVDIFGATTRSVEKQRALEDYQKQAYRSAYLSITGNVTTTALSIAMLKASIHIVEDIVREDQESLKLIQQSYDYGAATKTDVLTAEKQLKRDEAYLPALYQDLSEAENQMNILVSKTPENWSPAAFKFDHFTLPESLPLTLPSELVHTRPDILAAEAALHAANADIGIATAQLYPSIVLTGSILQEALTPSQLFGPRSTAFSYLAGLTAPLFSGGTLQAQKRAAEHAFQSSYANYQQVVVKSFIQVNDTLHALKLDADEEKIQQESVDIAKEALNLAKTSYKVGGAGILNVIQANHNYMEAQLGYIRVRTQRYLDTVYLYLALGGRSYPDQMLKITQTD
jgi:NodT family efflux transporter outer membrane factor (OMF) lipoprotein